MRVAVALIIDDKERILITRRPLHAPHGGMWEFPGGKQEENEAPAIALVREVKEEVGLDVHGCNLLGEIRHTYPHHSVVLHVYSVRDFSGKAQALEMQMDLRWVNMECLQEFDFPEANQQIIEMIRTVTADK